LANTRKRKLRGNSATESLGNFAGRRGRNFDGKWSGNDNEFGEF
jgi:hypothetical protein